MISKDFYGRNYVWWTGEVISREDPLSLGRVQVRIFGIHSLEKIDKNEKPYSKLPWAQVLYSANNSKTFASITPGDWVKGFFQDGENAQIPVIDGVYHVIKPSYEKATSKATVSSPSDSPSLETTNAFISEFDDPAIPAESNPPKMNPWQDFRLPDKPTIALLSQGIVANTPLSWTNQQIEAACTIRNVVNMNALTEQLKLSTIVQHIREGINALLSGLNADPTGISATLVSMAKDIAKFIKYLKSIVDEIKKIVDYVKSIIEDIAKFIQFIMSLPVRFMRFVMQCFSSFVDSVFSSFSGMMDLPDFKEFQNDDIKSLLTGIKDLSKATGETIGSVASTVNLASNVFDAPFNSVANISVSTSNIMQTVSSAVTKPLNNTISSAVDITGSTIDNISSSATSVTRYFVANSPTRDQNKNENTYSNSSYASA